ncbi:MAG: hypothetical protein HQK83_10215, partial [Fibrobacteria bacterium]|nr:hypothetical protein [Fibrobacteria bacterium]
MKTSCIKKVLFTGIIAAFCLSVVQAVEVERKPLVVGGYVDFGQIVDGFYAEEPDKEIAGTILQRTGAGVMQETIIEERMTIKVGVGGLFWYSFPQDFSNVNSMQIKFGPGVSTAHGVYKFGEVDDPFLEVQFGFFGYKYNSDALNLGEYLFQSNTYPGVLYTGGWSYMNTAAFPVLGTRLSFNNFDGALTHDFIIALERENFPINSISPGYVGTFKIGDIIELGLGFQWQHLIPVRPSWLTSSDGDAVWVEFDNVTLPTIADTSTYQYPHDTLDLVRPSTTGQISTLKSDAKEIEVDDGLGNNVSIYEYAYWQDVL